MHDSPSTTELLAAVSHFLSDVAMPQLSGHAQFHARVSANALALIARELEGRGAADARAVALYQKLLGQTEADLSALETALCTAIRDGAIATNDAKLLASLREVATAQLTIDQPNYSGLKQ